MIEYYQKNKEGGKRYQLIEVKHPDGDMKHIIDTKNDNVVIDTHGDVNRVRKMNENDLSILWYLRQFSIFDLTINKYEGKKRAWFSDSWTGEWDSEFSEQQLKELIEEIKSQAGEFVMDDKLPFGPMLKKLDEEILTSIKKEYGRIYITGISRRNTVQLDRMQLLRLAEEMEDVLKDFEKL